jgi:phosphopantetheine--protein transferase-like protein
MAILAGIDLVEIKQFETSVREGGELFLKKIFTDSEFKDSRTEHLAGIFAGKEAILKALSLKPVFWLPLEITKEANGRPKAQLPKSLASKYISWDLSISHSGNYAVAVFVALE